MKILSVIVENFGSYEHIEFNLQNQGLTLISGPTGSGKSTLCDLVAWGLFGITAKNGKADDIVSWNGGTTQVAIFLENDLVIHRIRGNKKNDLCYQIGEKPEIRGKDLTDTQRLINELLGVTPDLYLSAAYFHEFSMPGQFFTTTPKNRRAICEQLVDLSLPTKLQAKTSEGLSSVKKELTKVQHQIALIEDKSATFKGLIEQTMAQEREWFDKQREKISKIKQKSAGFDDNKHTEENIILADIHLQNSALEALQAPEGDDYIKCKTCGASKLNSDLSIYRLKKVDFEINIENFKKQLTAVRAQKNVYAEQLTQLEAETNPFTGILKNYAEEQKNLIKKYQFQLSRQREMKQNIEDLNILLDCLVTLRSNLIQNTIGYLQDQTNRYLTDYFDAEIKLDLTVTDNEKLDFELAKDGNICSYTQLSKGQRQLLKLCFGVAVMKCVSNRHNFRPNAIFFDECLDGLDTSMKQKAFGLLKSLELDYESIFCVEHGTEMKSLFSNEISVSLIAGRSEING